MATETVTLSRLVVVTLLLSSLSSVIIAEKNINCTVTATNWQEVENAVRSFSSNGERRPVLCLLSSSGAFVATTTILIRDFDEFNIIGASSNVAIDATSLSSSLLTVDDTVSFSMAGLMISNCRSESGGCLFAANVSSVASDSCSFSNATASAAGGALTVENAKSVRLSNSTFYRCSVVSTTNAEAKGGAVSIQSQSPNAGRKYSIVLDGLSFRDCSVTASSSSSDVFVGGGAVAVALNGTSVSGTVAVSQSVFSRCWASGSGSLSEGGAVSVAWKGENAGSSSSTKFTESAFSDCSVSLLLCPFSTCPRRDNASMIAGGAVAIAYDGDGSGSGAFMRAAVSISSASARDFGGGIAVLFKGFNGGIGSSSSVINSQIVESAVMNATSAFGGGGGGLAVVFLGSGDRVGFNATVEIADSTFSHCSTSFASNGGGGGVVVSATSQFAENALQSASLTFSGVKFSSCSAFQGYGGGAAVLTIAGGSLGKGVVKASFATFVNCYGELSGGGLYVSPGGLGGFAKGVVTVESSHFLNCSTTTEGGSAAQGGGLAILPTEGNIAPDSRVTVAKSSFTNCTSYAMGGGAAIAYLGTNAGQAAHVSVLSSTFTGCTATGDAVSSAGGLGILFGSELAGNGSIVVLQDLYFETCSAQSFGGGVAVQYPYPSTGIGGVIQGAGSLTFESCSATNSFAEYLTGGGGIAIFCGGRGCFEGGTIEIFSTNNKPSLNVNNCVTSGYGGGLAIIADADLSFVETAITIESAVMQNCAAISTNQSMGAGTTGGGMSLLLFGEESGKGLSMQLIASRFNACVASTAGGAIAVMAEGSLALGLGQVVFEQVTISESSVECADGVSGVGGGGAAFLCYGSNACLELESILREVSISQTVAGCRGGGGMLWDGGGVNALSEAVVQIERSSFRECVANYQTSAIGGAVSFMFSRAPGAGQLFAVGIEDTSFVNCRAGRGGAIAINTYVNDSVNGFELITKGNVFASGCSAVGGLQSFGGFLSLVSKGLGTFNDAKLGLNALHTENMFSDYIGGVVSVMMDCYNCLNRFTFAMTHASISKAAVPANIGRGAGLFVQAGFEYSLENSSFTIEGSIFSDCYGSESGCIHFSLNSDNTGKGMNIVVSGSVFSNVQATSTEFASGSALSASLGGQNTAKFSQIAVLDTSFEKCYSSGSGGCLSFDFQGPATGSFSSITLKNVTAVAVTSTDVGGFLFLGYGGSFAGESASLDITDSAISDSACGIAGAAVYIQVVGVTAANGSSYRFSNFHVSKSKILDYGSGAGIAFLLSKGQESSSMERAPRHIEMMINASSFSSLRTTGMGGAAIALFDVLYEQVDEKGGGSLKVSMVDSSFVDCVAGFMGGGIFSLVGTLQSTDFLPWAYYITIERCSAQSVGIEAKYISLAGGAVAIADALAYLYVVNSTFKDTYTTVEADVVAVGTVIALQSVASRYLATATVSGNVFVNSQVDQTTGVLGFKTCSALIKDNYFLGTLPQAEESSALYMDSVIAGANLTMTNNVIVPHAPSEQNLIFYLIQISAVSSLLLPPVYPRRVSLASNSGLVSNHLRCPAGYQYDQAFQSVEEVSKTVKQLGCSTGHLTINDRCIATYITAAVICEACSEGLFSTLTSSSYSVESASEFVGGDASDSHVPVFFCSTCAYGVSCPGTASLNTTRGFWVPSYLPDLFSSVANNSVVESSPLKGVAVNIQRIGRKQSDDDDEEEEGSNYRPGDAAALRAAAILPLIVLGCPEGFCCPEGSCPVFQNGEHNAAVGCSFGREGILCGSCRDGFEYTAFGTCADDVFCEETHWRFPVIVATLFVVALGYVTYLQFSPLSGSSPAFKSVTFFFNSLGVVYISVLDSGSSWAAQIVVFLTSLVSIRLPHGELSGVANTTPWYEICLWEGASPLTSLLSHLILPALLGLGLLIIAVGRVVALSSCQGRATRLQTSLVFLRNFLLALYTAMLLVYSSVIDTVLKACQCQTVLGSRGETLEVMFYAGEEYCWRETPTGAFFFTISFLVLLSFPLLLYVAQDARHNGVLARIKRMLCQRRRPRYPSTPASSRDSFLQPLVFDTPIAPAAAKGESNDVHNLRRFHRKSWKAGAGEALKAVVLLLEGPYRESCWWWEATMLYRRVVIVVLYVAIEVPLGRALALFCFVSVLLLLQAIVSPFRSAGDNAVEAILLTCLTLIAGAGALRGFMSATAFNVDNSNNADLLKVRSAALSGVQTFENVVLLIGLLTVGVVIVRLLASKLRDLCLKCCNSRTKRDNRRSSFSALSSPTSNAVLSSDRQQKSTLSSNFWTFQEQQSAAKSGDAEDLQFRCIGVEKGDRRERQGEHDEEKEQSSHQLQRRQRRAMTTIAAQRSADFSSATAWRRNTEESLQDGKAEQNIVTELPRLDDLEP